METNIQNQILMSSSAPARQELKPSGTGNNSLQVALNNEKIKNRAIEEIKEVLRLVMLKVGLRAANMPVEAERQILIEHIITNYAGHTCEEIKLAFEMAIAGKLNVEANCYENFSCLYFSGIMNAYRSWALEEKSYLDRQAKPELKQLPESKEDAMSDKDFIEMNKNIFKGSKLWCLISTKCYDILVANGELKLTEQDKEVIQRKARAHFFSPENTEQAKGTSFDQQERFIKQNCKKIAVAEYFNQT